MSVLILLLAMAGGDSATYGAPIKQETPMVAIADLMKNPESYLDKVVKVRGEVKEVCPMKGCWLDLAENGQKMRVKVKDGEIVFDKKLIGQSVIAEGTVYKFELSHEQAVSYYRHLAEEKGEAFDPESIKGPATIYQIGGIGVALAD